MPDLSDLLKHAVGDVPEFSAPALLARRRRQRRVQAAVGAGAAIVVVGSVVAVVSTNGNHHELVSTRNGGSEPTDLSTTTQYPYLYDTTAPRPTDRPGATDTTGPAPTVSATTTTPVPMEPQAGDFTGAVTAQPTTLRVGETVDVGLTLRNHSDHSVLPYSLPIDRQNPIAYNNNVATICVPLTADGRPARPIQIDTNPVNLWFAGQGALAPDAQATYSAVYEPTAGDVGTVTCEAAIVSLEHGYTDITFVARITAIPPVTITVLPASSATTAAGASTTVPTTVPTS